MLTFWGNRILRPASKFTNGKGPLTLVANYHSLGTSSKIYHQLKHRNGRNQPIECNIITDVVDALAEENDRVAIRCFYEENETVQDITYKSLSIKSKHIASYYKKKGFVKGDSVALILGQRPEWWYGLAGLIRAGISVVPCPKLLTAEDLRYRINDLKIKGIISSHTVFPKINTIKDACPSLIDTIVIGDKKLHWLPFNETQTGAPYGYVDGATTSLDPCVYLYTSGTTGQPKAVRHNHDYPFFHLPTGSRWLQSTADDLIYNASDTGWGFTVWTTMASWTTGSKLLITPTDRKFNAEKMLRTIESQKVTIFCAAPTVLRLLVIDPAFNKISLSHLKKVVTVGEALDETVIQKFSEKGVNIHVGFGQAETPLLIGRVDDQPHVPGTMGRPISPYKVVALDPEFTPVQPGNIGQIAVDLIEGFDGGIMREYANHAEKTKTAYSPDGRYYLTGDWATYHKNGLFSYQGRQDDLIKSRGYRIGPDEVEKAGMSHPSVAKIAVVGVRTDLGSSATTVKAFVLLKPGQVANGTLITDIQNHIKQVTAPHKYPRLIEFLAPEEWASYETTSGKIRRRALREREELKLSENNSNGLCKELLTF